MRTAIPNLCKLVCIPGSSVREFHGIGYKKRLQRNSIFLYQSAAAAASLSTGDTPPSPRGLWPGADVACSGKV